LKKIKIKEKKELKKIINQIKKSNKKIILINGPLGSGKTTLIKEFVKSETGEEATSPTFSLQNKYGKNIYHYDVYQKKDAFLNLGMIEELEKEGYHFIEWGEEIEDLLKLYGFDYMKIDIEVKDNERIFICHD